MSGELARKIILVDYGMVVDTHPPIHPLPPTFRVVVPKRLSSALINTPIDQPIEPEFREYKYLTTEEGAAIYIRNTDILSLLGWRVNREKPDLVDTNIDIKSEIHSMLLAYTEGIKNLTRIESPERLNEAISVLTYVISQNLKDKICLP